MLCFVALFPGVQRQPARWVGNLSEGPPDQRGLSATDRQYLQRVRFRLFNANRRADAVRGDKANDPDAESDALFTAALPDDEDEMEDILFDRSPKNVNQVKLFGAWLDDAVAGRKTNKRMSFTKRAIEGPEGADASVESHKSEDLSVEQAVEQGKTLFDQAMLLFNKGQYRFAIDVYAKAVEAVGLGSRLGGQYQLWYAQALDAAGEKKGAITMLDELRTHADADVRKVSRELLFIVTAPVLELDPGTFLDLPSLHEKASMKPVGVLTSAYGPLRTALLRKKPDRYTLEWYLEQGRPPKVKDNSAMETLLVASAVLCTIALFFHPH